MDGHDNADRDLEDTDKLLYTDLSENSSVLGLDCLPPKLDHCDLLLDAMDAQLDQLKVQPPKCVFSITKEHDCSNEATLRWSQSLSKDTGIGSATQTNDSPMSCLELMDTPMMEQICEKTLCCWEGPVTHRESQTKLDRNKSDKEEIESWKEQVIWRLERLLGDACKEREVAEETQPPSESICTEDLVRCFREEMVELTLSDSMQQQDNEEKAKRIEISDSGTCVSDLNGSRVERQASATTWRSREGTEMAHSSQSNNPGQIKQQKTCLSKEYGVNMSPVSQEAGAEERGKTPQRHADDGNDSHRPELVINPENSLHNRSSSPKTKCLAGVPVWSFDTVSIDSDLDTVCSEQVRQHIHKWTGWCSLVQAVTDPNDYCSDQSDGDTPTQKENEHLSTSGGSSSYRCLPNRSLSVHEAQTNGRETWSGGKDTDEEVNHWSWTPRPVRTPEKMQSGLAKTKDRLFYLQQKCNKEEETLRLKRTQLKDAELDLSELRQKRKHAVQQVERLTTETTQMEKEKSTLESILRDSRAEKELVSFQLQKLQKQRESCLLEVRDIEGHAAALHRRKHTFKDGSCVNRSRVMSALEREEMDRQLDCAKTKLFAEQRHAREKIESLQEKLEETREELHGSTEMASSLRNRCDCLEEKQMQKKQQIEALQLQVSKVQLELGECKIRVGVLDKMLTQKEQQLLDLQETCGTLQKERDELKRALEHLKTQQHKELEEAREQTHTMMINKEGEEEKVNALQEETLSLMQHIESLQSSIQLQEEEIIKLRTFLQQERETAEKREEELHAETLETVRKAVEEERRKCEDEKVEAVEKHRGIVEEQNRKTLESLMSEMESKSLALQHQVVELKTKMQELKSESCAQQSEQESLLAAVCKSLKEEHQAELQRSETHMVQQNQRRARRLEQDARLAVEESGKLRAMLEERESSHKLFTAEMEQQIGHWAQQLEAECWHLHILVEPGAEELPQSLTVAEALAHLRTLREQLKHFISHLHLELDSQKRAKEQLSKDKERELSIQRQQLRMDREQALNSVKDRLIQEHVEELSSLKWAHMSDGGAAASLRRQLKAKDMELRQVQRSMAQWKERTAARLARKFKEELTTELERKAPKTQEVRPIEETKLGAKEDQKADFSPSLHAVDSHSPSDLASFKLLRYLQSRVKQLSVENQDFMWSPPQDMMPLDLSETCLTTITHGQDSEGILNRSSRQSESGHETLQSK